MKEWSLFLISLGCVLIMLSSTMLQSMPGIVSGAMVAVVGVVLLLRKKKGDS
jgi:membrane-bound ClpP family serine protease